MAKKMIEVDPVVIQKKAAMDDIVQEIKEIDYSIEELSQLHAAQQESLKATYEGKKLPLTDKRSFLLGQLIALFSEVPPSSDTKTQKKVTLLNGDVVVKKPTRKLDYDKNKLFEVAEQGINEYVEKQKELLAAIESTQSEIDKRRSEDPTDVVIDKLVNKRIGLEAEYDLLECEWAPFIKSKEVREFDWASFKERLAITENGIVDTETGELVNIEGLAVKEVPEEVQVKY